MGNGGQTRRSVLGVVAAFGVAGLARFAPRPSGFAADPTPARTDRPAVGLVVYNADDARRRVWVRVTDPPDATTGASAAGAGSGGGADRRVHFRASRALDPGDSVEFEGAIPAPTEPAEYLLAIRPADGTGARRRLLLGPPETPGEVHAVLRESGGVDVAVVPE